MQESIMDVTFLELDEENLIERFVVVSEEMKNVYDTLRKEGVDVKIIRLVDCVEEGEVSIEEAYAEDKATYVMKVNFASSNLTPIKFHQYIKKWGFKAIM
jgi:hypothetical protein